MTDRAAAEKAAETRKLLGPRYPRPTEKAQRPGEFYGSAASRRRTGRFGGSSHPTRDSGGGSGTAQ